MQQITKADLEDEIEELTRGAVISEYLDPWSGKLRRVTLGVKCAQNKWGQCVYNNDGLVQIRDWLRSRLWQERGVEV